MFCREHYHKNPFSRHKVRLSQFSSSKTGKSSNDVLEAMFGVTTSTLSLALVAVILRTLVPRLHDTLATTQRP
jgi:hypothetical protein